MLSSGERAEIQARADAATEGPWRIEKDSEIDYEAGIPFSEWPQTLVGPLQSDPTRWAVDHDAANRIDEVNELSFADAEFIAHAREDIPKLLAELARIEQALEVAVLAKLLLAFLEPPEHGGSWTYNPKAAADAVRTHVFGDNEGKTN